MNIEIQQIQFEIKWLENKMEEVKKEMVKRPSKIRHLNDLIRQKNERLEKLKKAVDGLKDSGIVVPR